MYECVPQARAALTQGTMHALPSAVTDILTHSTRFAKKKSNSNSEEYYRLYSIVKYTWALTFDNFCQVRKTLQSRNRR